MKSRVALLTVLATLAFCATPARANLTGITASFPGGGSVTNATIQQNQGKLSTPITDIADANPGVRIIVTAAGNATASFRVLFDPLQHGGNADFILWMGEQLNVGGYTATLTNIRVEDTDGAVTDYTFNSVLTSSAGGSLENIPNRVYLQDALAVTPVVGLIDHKLYDEVTFTIGIVGAAASDELTIDYVSNPEPGTLALFGLGLVGLGGVVVRRRRKLAAAQETTDSDA